ncbi:MAG: hypothetical protein ACREJN_03170, partial [Nitrospiraceae bacterium]
MTLQGDSSRGCVRLSRTRIAVAQGHLWIYAGFIEDVRGEPVAGDVVDVMASDGRFYAKGLYSP